MAKYIYHVTHTYNVPKIKKKGIILFQKSNWIKMTGERYMGATGGKELPGVFAFSHKKDAIKWASKMDGCPWLVVSHRQATVGLGYRLMIGRP